LVNSKSAWLNWKDSRKEEAQGKWMSQFDDP